MMKRLYFIGVLALTLAVPVAAQGDLPSLDDLSLDQWNVIEPGGDTVCSNGTPFSFFARPNAVESDNLMIYFQGGGACWFGNICSLSANPTYDPFVDDTDVPGPGGIFDFENEENPFADYDMVFVPYCTGDVHIGNSETTYDVGGEDVTIQHNGFNNVSAVLDWTFANYEAPETVFVAGSSAGAIPAPFYAEFVTEAYPDARIEVIADGAGGYRVPEAAPLIFGNWGTMDILTDLYADYTLDNLTFEAFYMEVGDAYPDISMTQYNTAADDVQISFLFLTGTSFETLLDLILANYEDIAARIENFDAFTAGGELHTVLGRPEFYTYAANGVRYVDWVAALVAGEDVESVLCQDCESPEIITGSADE